MHDSISETSSNPVSVVDIEPINFRQVFEEKQQLMSVRPISSTLQQTGGIRNGNFSRECWCRRKEVDEAFILVKIKIWVKDKVFNGLLTLVDDQRGQIEVSGAIGIKEEVTHPIWSIVLQDIFVFDLFMDMNPIIIHKPPQMLLIQGITDISYVPEGSRLISFCSKRKVYWY